MSTSSANATALPDRRRILSTLAAAGALGMTGLPAMAETLGRPDAALAQLEAQLFEAVAFGEDLAERCDDAYERFDPPDMPEALLWQKRDFPSVWTDPHRLDGIGDPESGAERYTYASDGVLEVLRARLAEWKAVPLEDRFSFADRDIARVEEIIAAIEVYRAKEAASLASCGYTAAAQAHDAQYAVIDELMHRIAATPAHTSEGVCVKARAALAVSHRNVDWLEMQLAERLAAPPVRLSEERRGLLALSAMIDAARLGEASTSDRRAA